MHACMHQYLLQTSSQRCGPTDSIFTSYSTICTQPCVAVVALAPPPCMLTLPHCCPRIHSLLTLTPSLDSPFKPTAPQSISLFISHLSCVSDSCRTVCASSLRPSWLRRTGAWHSPRRWRGSSSGRQRQQRHGSRCSRSVAWTTSVACDA